MLIVFFTLFGFLMRKPDWVIVAGIIFVLLGFNLALTGLSYEARSYSASPVIIVLNDSNSLDDIPEEIKYTSDKVNLTFEEDINIKFLSFIFIVIGLWLVVIVGFNYKNFLMNR